MTDRIMINNPHAKFVAVRRNSIVAMLPANQIETVADALADAGVELAHAQALRGSEGVALLDADGTEHGWWGRAVRRVQSGGSGQNERVNYAEALRNGKDVVAVPCADYETAIRYARVLHGVGGERILYFGAHAVEQLS